MEKNLEGWHDFMEFCLLAKDKKTLSLLFDFFLTPEEKTDLALRFLIVKELLKEEKAQRQLAKELNVSIAKITRGSNELKKTNSKFLMYLKDKLLK